MRFFTKPNFDFIGKRKSAFIFSAVLIGAGLISLAVHGGPKLSIDFKGGVLVQVKFDRQVTTEEIRSSLEKVGYGGVEIQRFSSGDEFILRGPYEEDKDVSGEMIAGIRQDIQGTAVDVRRVELSRPQDRFGACKEGYAGRRHSASCNPRIHRMAFRVPFRHRGCSNAASRYPGDSRSLLAHRKRDLARCHSGVPDDRGLLPERHHRRIRQDKGGSPQVSQAAL